VGIEEAKKFKHRSAPKNVFSLQSSELDRIALVCQPNRRPSRRKRNPVLTLTPVAVPAVIPMSVQSKKMAAAIAATMA
jgi:hypothetical protein